jgi:hypothetical protein
MSLLISPHSPVYIYIYMTPFYNFALFCFLGVTFMVKFHL